MKTIASTNVPHPFPYQGSKRNIAKYILPHFPPDVSCLIEPFCGAGAISLAAAAHGLAAHFVLNDRNKPLMDLWAEILARPQKLCGEYKRQWLEQDADAKAYFFKVRDQFNATHNPHQLLYLLARIVKGRYNSAGLFNQSADNRRLGMRPSKMRENIIGVSMLLSQKTTISAVDFRTVLEKAGEKDLIYMDPPYQGTSFTKDHRYIYGLPYHELVETLYWMNHRNLSYIISYDGATGEKTDGKRLPSSLSLQHFYIHAGRSSQATLLGDSFETVESLYLSASLVRRLQESGTKNEGKIGQQELAFA